MGFERDVTMSMFSYEEEHFWLIIEHQKPHNSFKKLFYLLAILIIFL